MSWKGVKSDLAANLPARPSMDVVMDNIEKTSVNDVIFDFIQQKCGKFILNSVFFIKNEYFDKMKESFFRNRWTYKNIT